MKSCTTTIFLFLSRWAAAQRSDQINEMRANIRSMTSAVGFPEVREFAEVDARRDNWTIEDLRVKIERILEVAKVKREPLVGQTVPESYLR